MATAPLPDNVMNAVGSQPAPGPGPGGPGGLGAGLGGPGPGLPAGPPGADQPPPEALAAMEAVGQLVPDIVLAVFQAIAGSGPGGPPPGGLGGPPPGGPPGGLGGPPPGGPPGGLAGPPPGGPPGGPGPLPRA